MKLTKLYKSFEKKWQSQIVKYLGCVKQLNVRLIALILPAVLLFQCCSTLKRSESLKTFQQATVTEKADSMRLATRVILKESVPASKTVIAVSLDSLVKLPSGSKYSSRSNQATAEVSMNGDTVYITATCDSLERWVEYYENLYSSTLEMHNEYIQQAEKEQKKITGGSAVMVIILTLFYLMIVILTINSKKKNG